MSAETIKNCWHHNMGIIPAEVSLVESTADVSSSSSTGLPAYFCMQLTFCLNLSSFDWDDSKTNDFTKDLVC